MRRSLDDLLRGRDETEARAVGRGEFADELTRAVAVRRELRCDRLGLTEAVGEVPVGCRYEKPRARDALLELLPFLFREVRLACHRASSRFGCPQASSARQ